VLCTEGAGITAEIATSPVVAVFDITSVHTHHVARNVKGKGKFHPSTDHDGPAWE